MASFDRPVIYDYTSVPSFIADMMRWRKKHYKFSVKDFAAATPGCSPALISSIAKGRRRLTRDKVAYFAGLLGLTRPEANYLDTWVGISRADLHASRGPGRPFTGGSRQKEHRIGRPKNELVAHWLNIFVREATRLKGFKAEPRVIHKLLGGIATPEAVEASFTHLREKGLIRLAANGKYTAEEFVAFTTEDIPDPRLNQFHKKSADLIKRGIDIFPTRYRHNDTYTLCVDRKNLSKIKKILSKCTDEIQKFDEDHPEQNERLYQVSINLTPVGGRLG